MKKHIFIGIVVFFAAIVTIASFFAFVMNSPTNILKRDILLSPKYYYELPSGGYIYIEDEYIRYNKYSFNGTLDYQITLNYIEVEE